MRRTVNRLLVSVVLLVGSQALAASTLKCKWTQDCYNCVNGRITDDCFLDCSVCGGITCLPGAGTATAAMGIGAAPGGPAGGSDSELLGALLRFPAEPLAEAMDPAVARVFNWFWRWHDAPITRRRHTLDLAGGVAIDGEPHDFEMQVRQEGDAQLYRLHIREFARVTLTVRALPSGGQELQYEFEPAGQDPARSGYLTLEAE